LVFERMVGDWLAVAHQEPVMPCSRADFVNFGMIRFQGRTSTWMCATPGSLIGLRLRGFRLGLGDLSQALECVQIRLAATLGF